MESKTTPDKSKDDLNFSIDKNKDGDISSREFQEWQRFLNAKKSHGPKLAMTMKEKIKQEGIECPLKKMYEDVINEMLRNGEGGEDLILLLQSYAVFFKGADSNSFDWEEATQTDESLKNLIGEFEQGLKDDLLSKIKDGNFLKKDFVNAYIRHIKYQNDVDLDKTFQDKNDIKELDEYFKTAEGLKLFNSTVDELEYKNFKGNTAYKEDKQNNDSIENNTDKEAVIRDFYNNDYKGTFAELDSLQKNLERKILPINKDLVEGRQEGKYGSYETRNIAQKMSEMYAEMKEGTTTILEGLSINYVNLLVDIDSDIITKGEKTKLPLGNFDIILNFDSVKNKLSATNDKSQKKQIIAENIKEIYRDTNWEKLWDGIKKAYTEYMKDPAKGNIDILAIIGGGLAAGILATSSGILGFAEAGIAFTTIHKSIKTAGYMAVAGVRGDNVEAAMMEGLGVAKDGDGKYESMKSYYIHSVAELATNTVMFGVFKGTDKAMKILGFADLEKAVAGQRLKGFALEGAKTGIEAVGLTEIGVISGSIEGATKQGVNKSYNLEEFTDEVKELYDIGNKADNFLDSYVYNYMLIGFVKTGAKGLKPLIDKHFSPQEAREFEVMNKVIMGNSERISELQNILKGKGYELNIWENGSGKLEYMVGNDRGNGGETELQELANILQSQTSIGRNYGKKLLTLRDWENGRGGSPFAEGRSIRGKTLADVASGFEGVLRMSSGFQDFVKNELPNMRHEGEIKSQAYLKILGEVKRYLQKDILTAEEMTFVDQMTETFMKGIKEKLANNKLSADTKYGDVKFMSEVFGKVVENINPNIYSDLIEKKSIY